MTGKLTKNQKITFTLATIALTYFGLLTPKAFGVSPAPDGCYPIYTTAEGCNAVNLLTTGAGNTGLGWYSLFSNSTGSFNTGVGGGALALNNADSNTAVGAAALLLNTSGTENTAVGTDTLVYNDSGQHNTAVGAFALFGNTSGEGNTALGDITLTSNTTGNFNTANGFAALISNETGMKNTALGDRALFSNLADGNTAVGSAALLNNTTGTLNTAVGLNALANSQTSSGNIALGAGAGGNVTTAVNVICIGVSAGENESGSCFIRNIWQQSGGSQAVFVNSVGKLGAQVSSRRFKDEIKPMEQASKVIYRLKPVSFRYKPEIEPTRPRGFGLIAEEVEKASPDLVARDKEGKAYSVRYDQVNAMLLNEFLNEHRKVEEHEATISQLKKDLATVVARLNDQNSKIQEVSAQIQMSKPAPQVAVSEQ